MGGGGEEGGGGLFERARVLKAGQVLVAGGEPTVIQRGHGRGGRCTELAVRFALRAAGMPLQALFASSDGVDGRSGAAGGGRRGIPPLRVVSPTRPLGAPRPRATAASVREPVSDA